MRKWVILAAVLIVLGYAGHATVQSYRAGYFSRPEIPEGAFSVSYPSGLRGIVFGMPDEKTTRRYLGLPMEVPRYLQYVWSECYAPTELETQYGDQYMWEQNLPGLRLDAVCKIEVEGDVVVRGWVASTPRL